jgi:hypothetical protein
MSDRCDKCPESVVRGYEYCTSCGRPLGAGKKDGLREAIKIFGIILMFLCAGMLFLEVYAILWGFSETWNSLNGVYIFMLTPAPTVIGTLYGTAAKLYYLFIVISAIASFIVLLYMSRGGLKDVLRGKTDDVNNVPLYSIATLFAAVISFNVILNMFLTASGNPPGAPIHVGPEWGKWFSYLVASVWEEVICRILMIGLPMMLLGLMLREKGSRRRLFGRFDMDGAAVAFIIISSILFSYAHLAEWDMFKLLPTFISGLALGYLFVKYGIYASIMLHLLVNYMSSVIWVFGDGAENIVVLFMFTALFLGVIFFIQYTVRASRFVKNLFSGTQ